MPDEPSARVAPPSPAAEESSTPAWLAWWYALTIFVSAFLLFQVQPLISKTILPWFGGSPAVWTTCLLFFQVALLAGYSYAHLSINAIPARWQPMVHGGLLLVAICLLPIVPSDFWKPTTPADDPTWQILLLLAVVVGMPYLALAANAPLLQAWFGRLFPGVNPYRLYALSNVGSLLALLSYPFVFEPLMTTGQQGWGWSIGFVLFALLCGVAAWALHRAASQAEEAPPATRSNAQPATESSLPATDALPAIDVDRAGEPPGFDSYLLWILLPALASVLLLSTTSYVCQDIAVIPLLWVVPLSLYLLTFIIAFDSSFWYVRVFWATVAVLSILVVSGLMRHHEVDNFLRGEWLHARLPFVQDFVTRNRFEAEDFRENILFEAGAYFLALFAVAMICHGELVKRKPPTGYLTLYYLLISAGGALGGIFVAVICPFIFNIYLELHLALLGGLVVALLVLALSGIAFFSDPAYEESLGLYRLVYGLLALGSWLVMGIAAVQPIEQFLGDFAWWGLIGFGLLTAALVAAPAFIHNVETYRWSFVGIFLPPAVAAAILVTWAQVKQTQIKSLETTRTFYGVLHVVEENTGYDPEDHGRSLRNGRILHGFQYLDEFRRRDPTTYYVEDSGFGRVVTDYQLRGPIKFAMVGLGAGTAAAYVRPEDELRFYEINPEVERLARTQFTYIKDAPGKVSVGLGDARLVLERELQLAGPQNYDIIALDAFSGDAIPAHLLTIESFDLYRKHLKPGGTIAVHVSNRYLDLTPIVWNIARHYDMQALRIEADEINTGHNSASSASTWILVVSSRDFLSVETTLAAEEESEKRLARYASTPVWTDRYSNVFAILKLPGQSED